VNLRDLLLSLLSSGSWSNYPGAMVTHMVLFKFKAVGDAEACLEKLLSMRGRIASMVDLEAGIDFTKSERSFELGLITRHGSRSDLEAYRVDPVHQEAVDFIRDKAAGSAACDFETP
jgi:hypothetical protein